METEGDAFLDVDEFETQECMQNAVFTTEGLKRLSCFSDTLQLVFATFIKDPAYHNILYKAYMVVKQVSMSGNVTGTYCRNWLVLNCMTRWSSAYLVVSCLEVQDKLVILQQKITLLQSNEWEKLHHLPSKFARYSNVAGGEEY